jgi:hypothetical protein
MNMNASTSQLSRILMSGLLGVAALCLSANAQAQARIKGLELLDKLPTRSDLRNYKVVPPTAAESEQRAALAKQLGEQAGLRFQASEARYSDGRTGQIDSADPSASFEYNTKLGTLLFNGGLRKYRDDASTLSLPKSEEAAALARRQIQALKLPLSSAELAGVRVGGVNLAVPNGAGDSTIYEKFRTVRFSRAIAGVPVEGDSRVVVQLGSRGALAALVYQWPTVAAGEVLRTDDLVKTGAIREGALKQLEAITARADDAVLTAADLVLFDDGRGVVEPAYHFTVERYYADDKAGSTNIPFDFYLPAVTQSRALYPHLEVAAVKAKDGRDETPGDNGKPD